MTSTEKHIQTITKLGALLSMLSEDQPWPGYECGLNEQEYLKGKEALVQCKHHNGWFTIENVRSSLASWGQLLQEDKLNAWITSYPTAGTPRKIGIIMAGNIPLVGLHDLLAVILSGHHAVLKMSSKDTLLMMMVVNFISLLDEELGSKISVSAGKMTGHDAIIATGSNNTSRYFDYYFRDIPSIIRKNRTSIAILNGNETTEELQSLGEDIFKYFGLGCRNVTKLYLPEGYDLNLIFEAIYPFKDVINHNKYANNYDYHRAIWLLNEEDLLENGFILFKQDSSLVSPVGSLFYEFYSETDSLLRHVEDLTGDIQCIVSHSHVPFGKAQQPELTDYADGVNTLDFLSQLS